MSSGQGSILIGPYDPTYPAGWFGGMTLDIDPLPQSIPSDLGAHWTSFSLGDYNQQWDIVNGGGYDPQDFRAWAQSSWGSVTLTRSWFPNGSVAIAGWMAFAKANGPCTIAITVSVNPAAGQSGVVCEKLTFVFYNAVPTAWGAPKFASPIASSTDELATESVTFEFTGYDISTVDSSGSTIAPSYTHQRVKAPKARLRILLGGATADEALAALTTWNRAGTIFGVETTAGNDLVAAASSADPAIEFWLPPTQIQISKSSGWCVQPSPFSTSGGPVQWQGTDPMTISFNYELTCIPAEVSQIKNFSNKAKFNPNPSAADNGSSSSSNSPIDPNDVVSGPGSSTSIQAKMDQLLSLLETDPLKTDLGEPLPPMVMFEFGNFFSPVCYVTSVDMTVDHFDSNGNPQRATGSISLTEFPVPDWAQNPTSGGLVSEDQGQLYPGDSLAHVAYRFYRSPARWRDLAEANDIDDPMRIANGSRLAIPNVSTLPPRTEGGVVRFRPASGSDSRGKGAGG